MHFTCRDRNLMGIQGDLLGAHALGIRNILAMTGDPPRGGDYVNATAVFDVDAIGLARIVAGMNRGLDAAGNSIGEPTAFGIGVAVDPGAADRSREIDRLHAKIEAGAMWAQTQPVYDLEQLDGFLARMGPVSVPLIVGILPLHSFRHAEFLHNEVPGITIPDAVRARLRDAGDHALRVGIETAQAILAEVRRRLRRRLPHALVRALRGGRRGPRSPRRGQALTFAFPPSPPSPARQKSKCGPDPALTSRR